MLGYPVCRVTQCARLPSVLGYPVCRKCARYFAHDIPLKFQSKGHLLSSKCPFTPNYIIKSNPITTYYFITESISDLSK